MKAIGPTKIVILIVVCLSLAVSKANAQILIQHTGDNDPVASEGWQQVGSGGSAGPINDSGTLAWYANDTVSDFSGSSYIAYAKTPTDAQIANAQASGWTLSALLRLPNWGDTTDDGSPFLSYRNGTRNYQLHFGTSASGDPIVQLVTSVSVVAGQPPPYSFGPTVNLTGFGDGYHDYSLVYSPISSTATLFVDGIQEYQGYSGLSIAAKGVFWGTASSPDTGEGYFASVELTVVPEPSTFALLIVATLPSLAAKRRSPARR